MMGLHRRQCAVSDLEAVPPYEIYFERALAEYRELAGDFQDYAEFPIEVQNAVNHRAHQIKAEQEREKRVERA